MRYLLALALLATSAGSSPARFEVHTQPVPVSPNPNVEFHDLKPAERRSATADCKENEVVTGGGFSIGEQAAGFGVEGSYSDNTDRSWTVVIRNDNSDVRHVRLFVWAYCRPR